MRKRGRPRHPDILTPREWEVLALIRESLSNPEIAGRLGIGREGVKYHVSEILSKLGVASREEAAQWRPLERKPPWTLGGVPLSALWRRAKGLSPDLGPVATTLSASLLVAMIGGLALLGVLILRGEERREDLDELVAKVRAAMDNADYRLMEHGRRFGLVGLKDHTPIAKDIPTSRNVIVLRRDTEHDHNINAIILVVLCRCGERSRTREIRKIRLGPPSVHPNLDT